jgi:hypothetical protein
MTYFVVRLREENKSCDGDDNERPPPHIVAHSNSNARTNGGDSRQVAYRTRVSFFGFSFFLQLTFFLFLGFNNDI